MKKDNGSNNNKANKLLKRIFHYSVVALILCSCLIIAIEGSEKARENSYKTVTYQEFQSLVDDKKIDGIKYSPTNETMYAYLANKETAKLDYEEKKEYKYSADDTLKVEYPAYEDFRKEMLEAGVFMVLMTNASYDALIGVIAELLEIAIFIGIAFWFSKRLLSMEGNEAPDYKADNSDVTFDDIIGIDETIEDLKYFVELIKNPEKGEKLGVKTPKGALLVGPPGVGKTMIAKAMANEAGVPFHYAPASSFVDRFVGMGANNVRKLFKEAKKNTPCIVFIDELDALEKRDSSRTHSEDKKTVDALLTEIDGVNSDHNIFVICATNHTSSIDDALKRSGRLDREIHIPAPRDWKIRKQLFEHYLKDKPLGDDVDLEILAKEFSGSTGADIANICNESGIKALMRGLDYITMDCIEESIDELLCKGNRSRMKQSERSRNLVAYHEAGHAVMMKLLDQPITRATILGTTSGVGGFVMPYEKDYTFKYKSDFENDVMIAYGGRASESIKFGEISVGASNDITQATQLIKSYLESYGFDDEFGLVDMNVFRGDSMVSADSLVPKVTELSKSLYARCENLLKANYNMVETLANELLDKESLSGKEIDSLLDGTFKCLK